MHRDRVRLQQLSDEQLYTGRAAAIFPNGTQVISTCGLHNVLFALNVMPCKAYVKAATLSRVAYPNWMGSRR
jgi:hypothetical protein